MCQEMKWLPNSGIIRPPKTETSNNYPNMYCRWIINPHRKNFNALRVTFKNTFNLGRSGDILRVI